MLRVEKLYKNEYHKKMLEVFAYRLYCLVQSVLFCSYELVGLYIIIYVKVYSGGSNVIDIIKHGRSFCSGKMKLHEFYLNVTRWR